MADSRATTDAPLNGGALDGKTYLSPNTFAAMTTDHIGPLGVARDYFYYPGTVLIWLWFWCPHRSRQCGAAAAGFAREINGMARLAPFVIDRAQDMFLSCCKTRHRPGSMCK